MNTGAVAGRGRRCSEGSSRRPDLFMDRNAQADAQIRDPSGSNAGPCSSQGVAHGTDVRMPEISAGPIRHTPRRPHPAHSPRRCNGCMAGGAGNIGVSR
jgi:hypothetical protein